MDAKVKLAGMLLGGYLLGRTSATLQVQNERLQARQPQEPSQARDRRTKPVTKEAP